MKSAPTATRSLVKARSNGYCERCGLSTNLEMSHRIAKGMGGSDKDQRSPALYNALCHRCHAWVEANPTEALATGWKVPRNTDPTQYPYRHWAWGWVRPADDGSMNPSVHPFKQMVCDYCLARYDDAASMYETGDGDVPAQCWPCRKAAIQ